MSKLVLKENMFDEIKATTLLLLFFGENYTMVLTWHALFCSLNLC
jgi:hypothetical protein